MIVGRALELESESVRVDVLGPFFKGCVQLLLNVISVAHNRWRPLFEGFPCILCENGCSLLLRWSLNDPSLQLDLVKVLLARCAWRRFSQVDCLYVQNRMVYLDLRLFEISQKSAAGLRSVIVKHLRLDACLQ